MVLEEGKFYFINNDFIHKYGLKYKLMENKESGNKRPSYFCFFDIKNKNLLWFVPISSKYGKYKAIYDKAKEKYTEVLGISFGNVKGKDTVFLIQNMFPCTEKYIIEKYRNNNEDIKISKSKGEEIIAKARRVIFLSENKNMKLTFTNIVELKKELLKEKLN